MVVANGDDVLPRLRKARGMLAYLCLARGERVSRTRLIGLLWDRSADRQAQMSLRHALAELNHAARAARPDFLEYDREAVRLNPKAVWVDALADPVRVERLGEELHGRLSPAFDRWLEGERARLENAQRLHLEHVLDRLVAQNAEAAVRIAAARKLLDFEPTHEAALRALMTALAQSGNRPRAMLEYEQCKRTLRRMLDIGPSRETASLYRAIQVAQSPEPIATSLADRLGIDLSGHETRAVNSRPRVMVMPFVPLAGDSRSEIGAILIEDLIDALSRAPDIVVVSRLVSLDSREHGPAWLPGSGYVVSGSIRTMGDRLRLTAEVADGRRGTVLSSMRFDETAADPIDMCRRWATEITQHAIPRIHAAELRRIRRKRPETLDAHELFLCARDAMHNSTREVFATAESLFERAIEQDPHHAGILAWRAYYHLLRIGQGWSSEPEYDAARAEEFARRAVDVDATEPMALAVKGHLAAYLRRDLAGAFECFELALRVDPHMAPARLWNAAAHAYSGHHEAAVKEIERAMALSPCDPLMYAYTSIASLAYLAAGKTDIAVNYARRSAHENPSYTTAYKLLVMGLSLGGRIPEAQMPVRRLLELEPGFCVQEFRRRSPTAATSLGDAYCDSLTRAGLPIRR